MAVGDLSFKKKCWAKGTLRKELKLIKSKKESNKKFDIYL